MAVTASEEVIDIRLRSIVDVEALNSAINTMQSKIEASQERISQIRKTSSSEALNYLKAEENLNKANLELLEKQLRAYKELTAAKNNQGAGYFQQRAGLSGAFAYQNADYTEATAKSRAMYSALEKESNAAMEKVAKSNADAYNKSFWGAIEGGTTFGHKIATTAQYALAGTALYALGGAATSAAQAFLESDKAYHMFIGVLDMTATEARKLQTAIFDIGKAYGGSITDLNETALALGRAGIAGKDLVEGMKVVSQVALVSGESLLEVTDVLVSWKTLYPDKTMTQLGDSIVTVANATKASIGDFKTMSTYILTAGQQAGLSEEALVSFAGAFKQIGKGSSTAGTEIRRFFNDLSVASKDVRQAYDNLGINLDAVRKGLEAGGTTSEATMRALFHKLASVGELQGKQAIEGIGAVLDKATIQSLLAIAHSGEQGFNEFDRILSEVHLKAKGSTDKAAKEVALSYSKIWEGVKNALSQGSVQAGQGLADALIGSVDAKKFSEDMNIMTAGVEALILTTVGFAGAAGATKLFFSVFGGAEVAQKALLDLAANLANANTRAILFEETTVALKSALGSTLGITALATTGIIALGFGMMKYAEYANSATSEADDFARSQYNLTKAVGTSAGALEYLNKTAKEASDSMLASQLTAANKRLTELKEASMFGGTVGTAVEINRQKFIVDGLEREIRVRKTLVDEKQKAAERDRARADKEAAEALKNITGRTVPKPDAREAARDARQLVDAQLAAVKAAEERYFVENNITKQIEQQRYHVNVTVPAMQKVASTLQDRELRMKKLAEIDLDGLKTKNAIQTTERNLSIEVDKRITALGFEKELAGKVSDERKLQIEHEKRISAIKDEAKANDLKGMSPEQVIRIRNEALATEKEITDEALKRLNISKEYNNIRLAESNRRMLEDRKMMTDYQKEEVAKLREAKDLELQLEEREKTSIVNTEEKRLILEKIGILRKQATLEEYKNNQLQLTMQSSLNSGLMDFFNIQSQGWMDFQKLGLNVLNSLLQKIIEINIVQPLASSGAGLFGSLISSAGSFFSSSGGATVAAAAKGDVFGAEHYAKGGTFTNQLLSKPTYFAHGGGFGVMGEAGTEAVMPLKRTATGELGVVAQGNNSAPQNVKVEIVNQSGSDLKVTQSEGKFDGENFILSVVIDAMRRNRGGFRDAMSGGR